MTTEHDQLHEKLCAYVLGEASADERAEIERELARSSALRAQKAEIEATIGFVKDAMAGGETLSHEATREVLSAAKTPKARPWYTFAPVKIAAGLAALIGGFAVYRVVERPTAENAGPFVYDPSFGAADAIVQAEPRRKLAPEAKGKNERLLDGSGYAESDAKDQKLDAALIDSLNKNETVAHEVAPVYGSPSASPAEPRDNNLYFEKAQRDQEQLGFPAQAPEVEVFDQGLAGVVREGQQASTTHEGANGAATGQVPAFGGRKRTEIGKGGVRRSDVPMASGPSGPSTPAPVSPTGGTYVGPGDSVPAAGERVAALDALRGLGYAGADEQSSAQQVHTGIVSGSDDFFLGRAAGKQLAELGYVGGDSDEARYRYLTPEQREQYIDQECRRLFGGCRRRPNERPRDMFFRFWGDNAFELAALDPQSTFSVDVDTASYALARRYLNDGHLPEKAQIRTEEFLNYFKADVPAPKETTFAVHTDLAPSRFSSDASRSMLRVVVRGREVAKLERKPVALTFVVDTSGSMKEQNRLEMVKHTMRLLVGELDPNDSIAIVRFSDDASLVLPMTSAKNRGLIESAIHPLQPQSSTNAEAGLRMGYEAALAGINPNATNRVVFLSDGVANVGQTDQDRINESVKNAREKGVYLNTVGVGMNNHNDTLLEQLADKGDGVCNYIDTPEEAKRALVDNFTGAFQPIARDVKIQVEFDPAQVYRYRLLGYENRAIADKDFRNDAIDAGEIGAGHQVTALYEIERTNQASEKPLATVRLRWKEPHVAARAAELISKREPQLDAGETARLAALLDSPKEVETQVLASRATSFEGAGAGYRRAVIVAQFAELLRRSTHARGDSLDDLIAEAQKLEREANDADFSELVLLMNKSRALILRDMPRCDELCQAIDVVRRNQILRAEHESLSTERDAKLLEELEKQNADLEARIRELLRRKLEQQAK